MRELKLVAIRPRRLVVTTDSNHGFPVASNPLNGEFDVDGIADVNQKWAGDITRHHLRSNLTRLALSGSGSRFEKPQSDWSMSCKGNCWDNAPIESFFATMKKELIHRQKYQNHQQAKASLFYYIEVFYNRKG